MRGNTAMKQKTDDNHGANVTKAVATHAKIFTSAKGKAHSDSHEKLQVMIDVALRNTDNDRAEALKLLNLNKRRCDDHFNNNERVMKTRADHAKEIAK